MGRAQRVFTEHALPVAAVAVGDDGAVLSVGTDEVVARDTEGGVRGRFESGMSMGSVAVCAPAGDRVLVTGGRLGPYGTLHRLPGGEAAGGYEGWQADDAALTHGGACALLAGSEGAAWVDLRAGRPRPLPGLPAEMTDVGAAADGVTVLTRAVDGGMALWRLPDC